MSFIAIFLIFIAIILLISLLKKDTDIFSPGRLFSIVWSLAIGLTELKLSWFQKEWDIISWFILLINIFAFLLGIYTCYIIYFNKNIYTLIEIRNLFKKFEIDKKKSFNIILVLSFFYFISYVTIFVIVGFIPLLTLRPDLARTKWSLFGFGLIIHIAPIIIYSGSIYIIAFLNDKLILKSLIIGIIIISTLGSYLLLVQRFDLMISVVLLVVYLYYTSFKITKKNLAIFASLILLIIFGISQIRTSSIFIDYLYITSNMKYSSKYAVLTEPYMYIVMNLENFVYSVGKIENFGIGLFTFDFLWAVLGLKHNLLEYTNFNQFPPLITNNYNTLTMFINFYRDFGIIGSFIFPYFLGFLISHSYFKLKFNPNFTSISIYGMFCFIMIFSFFVPMISWLHFVFNFILLVFVSKYLDKHLITKVN